jgi:hypothetical protein
MCLGKQKSAVGRAVVERSSRRRRRRRRRRKEGEEDNEAFPCVPMPMHAPQCHILH